MIRKMGTLPWVPIQFNAMFQRILIAVLICAAIAPARGYAGEVVGRGDFEFFLDAAVFRAPDGSTRQEVYLRVPHTGVRFREASDGFEGRVRLSLRIYDAAGETVAEDSSELKMYARSDIEATSPLKFQTLTRIFPLAEGTYRLSCAIEDLNSPKVTIVGMMRGSYKESVVTGYPLEVPTFPTDRMTFSDAKFLWRVGSQGDVGSYVPNPSRLYGLYKDSLRVYVEAYVPRSAAGSGALELQTEILDDQGEKVTTSSVTLAEDPTPAARSERAADGLVAYPLLLTEDLNRFRAGSYSLHLTGGRKSQVLVRVRAGSFNVVWDMHTWEVSRRNFVAEARFLLDGKDFDLFLTKDIGDQEIILQEMWTEIDPDPSTGVNEAYEKFMERLAYVNAKYTDYQLGIFTDRGLIHLKYGPPDEKVVDVIPLNRESVSDALEKIRDKYHPVNFSNTGGRMGYATPSQDIIVDPRRLGAIGEGGNTAYPYELWIYDGTGDPILDRDRNLEPDEGLRFIFVDREGYGRYRLESSSSMSNK